LIDLYAIWKAQFVIYNELLVVPRRAYADTFENDHLHPFFQVAILAKIN